MRQQARRLLERLLLHCLLLLLLLAQAVVRCRRLLRPRLAASAALRWLAWLLLQRRLRLVLAESALALVAVQAGAAAPPPLIKRLEPVQLRALQAGGWAGGICLGAARQASTDA